MIRKEQEARLRKEVSTIITSHLKILSSPPKSPNDFRFISIGDLVDDIMGAVNQEDNYRLKDYQLEIEKQRESMKIEIASKENQCKYELAQLKEIIDEKNLKIAKLQKELIPDIVKKDLEKKIARLQRRAEALKKLVQVTLEDM